MAVGGEAIFWDNGDEIEPWSQTVGDAGGGGTQGDAGGLKLVYLPASSRGVIKTQASGWDAITHSNRVTTGSRHPLNCEVTEMISDHVSVWGRGGGEGSGWGE